MRSITTIFSLDRLTRLLASFSVRTRIVVLALVPVAGFLANGLTYVSGENAVGTAFNTVQRAGALADASRDFKSAIASMRLTVKDFGATPNNTLVVELRAGPCGRAEEPRHHRQYDGGATGRRRSPACART